MKQALEIDDLHRLAELLTAGSRLSSYFRVDFYGISDLTRKYASKNRPRCPIQEGPPKLVVAR
jgi:hypothetical protein